eukprot:m.348885 g.348885  ORF g.348885 m.348885 type:complete len:100 (+) comp16148_c1_seq17:3673-3972(+)
MSASPLDAHQHLTCRSVGELEMGGLIRLLQPLFHVQRAPHNLLEHITMHVPMEGSSLKPFAHNQDLDWRSFYAVHHQVAQHTHALAVRIQSVKVNSAMT